MAGILDYLTGNDGAASPWGMLYQQPAPQTYTDYSMGFPVQTPASPFGDPSHSSVADPTAPPPAPPATGFGAGASPFGFAGPGSMTGINPAMMQGNGVAPGAPGGGPAAVAQQPAPPATDLSSVNRPAPAPAAADEGPDSMVPVGKYQMPMYGEAPDAPAAPARPAGPAPLSLGGGSSPGIGDRLGMAARGFMGNMGAGPIGALMAGTGSLLMGRESDPTAIAQGKVNMTARALLNKGVEPAVVQAAMSNPEVMKTLIAQNFGPDKFQHVTKKDAFGGETIGAFDPTTGKTKWEGDGGGSSAIAGAAAMPPMYDPKTRRDDAFIKALDPITQQVVEAAYNGDNVPQGRNLQKYMPIIQRAIQGFDPSSYLARQSFNREMGSGKAGYGMQVSGFQQGLEHVNTLAQRYLQKGNVNGLGFPDVAHMANAVGEHLSNDQAGHAIAIANEGQQAAGEIGKLFSGAQGGGVHEREQTKSYLGNSRASGPEAAAGLESTLDLMMGGLSKLEQARDRAYDGNAPAKYNFIGEKQQAQIDQIRSAIQQLKSGASAPASAAAPAAAGGTVNVGGKPISWKVN